MAPQLSRAAMPVVVLVYVQFILATAIANQHGSKTEHFVVPLTQHNSETNDIVSQSLHAVAKHGGKPLKPLATDREYLDGGFWYGSFEIGQTKNLSLLIDTGSQDVAVNANLYEPTAHSKNLHRNGTLYYLTTQINGCGSADISYDTYADSVRMAGLMSQQQTFANIVPSKPSHEGVTTDFPHDGLIGFSGTRPNDTQLNGMPFFQNLCNQRQVEQCRFGLALGTKGKGYQILGGVDVDQFDGELSTAPLWKGEQWLIESDIVVNTSVLLKDQFVFLDSGTANIVGPTAAVRHLFEELGIQAVQQHLPGCSPVLFGYYPCDSPPQVGFRIGRDDSPAFHISPAAFRQSARGSNNCTATITGIDFHSLSGPLWIVGQPWFQGKYVDFDVDSQRIGVATLKHEDDCD